MQTQPSLFLSSGDLIADRRFAWAKESQAKDDLAGAAGLMMQVLELAPGYAAAWFALGEIREKLGDRGGAIEAFGKAREADPEDRHGAALHLVRLGAAPEGEMPRAYLSTLFDGYAPGFDRALVEGLNYRAPSLLLSAVASTCRDADRPMRFGTMLDLGCGTGLAGAAFRPHVDWLAGVDLSTGMLAQARAKGLYDRLKAAEILHFLDSEVTDASRYHLIVAADVLVYFAELATVAARVAQVLELDGLFAFTVETHDGDGAILRETLRYAHSSAQVRAALEYAGLFPLKLEAVSTRTEKQQPVPGLLVVATSMTSPFNATGTP